MSYLNWALVQQLQHLNNEKGELHDTSSMSRSIEESHFNDLDVIWNMPDKTLHL